MSNQIEISSSLMDLIKPLIGVIVGAFIVIWQTSRQQKIGSALQREKTRDELKLNLYERLRSQMDAAHKAETEFDSYISFLTVNFRNYLEFVKNGITPAPIRYRATELIDLNTNHLKAITDLVKTLEDFQVVEPNIKVFLSAFLSISYDIQQSFRAVYDTLHIHLPIDLPASATPDGSQVSKIPSLPTNEKLDQIDELISIDRNCRLESSAFLYDLRVEAQNLLMGNLFGNVIPQREPKNPDLIVLSTDSSKVDQLLYHFENETEWGKNALG